MNRSRSAFRLVAAAMIIGMLAPAATTTATAAGDAAAGGDATSLRGRAGHYIATYDPDAPKTESQPAREPSPSSAPSEPAQQQERVESELTAASTATDCLYTETLWSDVLMDRRIVHARWEGAASMTLTRMRGLGAWTTIRTFSGDNVTYTDRDISPEAFATYRMVAKNAAGSVLSDCTHDSYGVRPEQVDAVVAHLDALVIHANPWRPTPAVPGGPWVTPAYSADGRLLAATRVDPATGVGVLEVRRSRDATRVFSVDLGPDVSVADPAFSFDGQTLAYSRYDTLTGAPLGLGFVDVHGSHAKRTLTATVPVAEPAWRPNGTLVVSTFGAWEGLANLCSTCTTVSPISGTVGGYTAEVGADNSVYFTVTDEVSSALKKISPSGSVATLRTSESDFFINPRLSPSGRVFVERDAPNPNSPDPHVRVVEVTSWGDEHTGIGAYDYFPAYGYDVRQPRSKGSSHFTGDINDDLVVRDGYGKLWAYPGTDRGLGARTQIGSGWSTYTAVVPVGDLTSDDRADLLGRDAYGKLWLYPGVGNGKFGARVQMGSGWNPYTLVAPGDWDGDDKADLIARDSSGYLWLYPGNGTGRLGARKLIGSGWAAFNVILGAGDANYDNKGDLITRDRYGRLWLYPGNGRGGFLAKRQIGSGWGGFTALSATQFGDTTWVWARTSAGQLLRYPMLGDGSFMHGYWPLGYGWNGLLITS